jgi:ribosomal protein L5
LTKFNKINSYSLQKCLKLVCHLSFKNINFDKKKIIVSLFLLEILSSQKSFLIQSNSNNILLKIRKGSPVGCKVTLRNTKMYEMFDSLALAFTNISTRSFIKISKKMTIYGGRFFCYQIDSFERFFYLSSLVLGEQPRKIDFC